MTRPCSVLAHRHAAMWPRLLPVLSLALVLALSVGCAPGPAPTFTAYWYTGSQGDECPPNERCVLYTQSLERFEELRRARSQRTPRLELVDFDAHISDEHEVYAGVWRRSDREHHFLADLEWGQLVSENQKRSKNGEQLINLKVYDDHGRQRVAAIWRPGDQKVAVQNQVSYNLTWTEFNDTLHKMSQGPKSNLFLTEIEVYRNPGKREQPFIAAVWQAGQVETELLTGLACDEVLVNTAQSPGATDGTDRDPVYSECELLTRLYKLNDRGSQTRFRAVDFERYTEDGVKKWAVLLQKRSEQDWLLIPGNLESIALREESLNQASTGHSFALFDLDIYAVGTADRRPPPYHEGVVHDGGTSGPPP